MRRGLEGDGDGSVRRYVLRDALVGPDVGVAGGEMKGADQVSPGEQDLLAESRKAVVQQRGPIVERRLPLPQHHHQDAAAVSLGCCHQAVAGGRGEPCLAADVTGVEPQQDVAVLDMADRTGAGVDVVGLRSNDPGEQGHGEVGSSQGSKVVRRRVAAVVEPVGAGEARVVQAHLLGGRVHRPDEPFDAPAAVVVQDRVGELGQGHRGVVRRLQQGRVEECANAHPLPHLQLQRGQRLLRHALVHRQGGAERVVAQDQQGGHQLGQAGYGTAMVRLLGEQHLSGIEILYQHLVGGDRRRRETGLGRVQRGGLRDGRASRRGGRGRGDVRPARGSRWRRRGCGEGSDDERDRDDQRRGAAEKAGRARRASTPGQVRATDAAGTRGGSPGAAPASAFGPAPPSR